MPTKTEIAEFSELINEMAINEGMTRMEAIIHHCEKIGLEVDVVPGDN